jgi:hypothetical protein
MTEAIILGGVNITGRFRNARKPVKTIRIARGLPCRSKRTIVNYLVLMVISAVPTLVLEFLGATGSSRSLLVI